MNKLGLSKIVDIEVDGVDKMNNKDYTKEQEVYLRKNYPNVFILGANVDFIPCEHIPSKQLRMALKKHKINLKKFNKAFGINTCLLLDNGDIGLYLVDIERTLKMVVWGYEPSIEEWD